jgi:hypothetical protein
LRVSARPSSSDLAFLIGMRPLSRTVVACSHVPEMAEPFRPPGA